jgi:hypothetical protein
LITASTGAGRLVAARHRLRISIASAIALAAISCAACGGGGTSSSDSTYGGLPTFLPSPSIQPDSQLTGTTAEPALTTEGDSVLVKTATASVEATVSGPIVPGEGLPYQAPATTCTWTVSLSHASATVPIRLTDFTSLDHLGTVYHMTSVVGEPSLPTSVAPGQTVTFKLQAVMRTGEGIMRWAPNYTAATSAPQIVASWDFVVEND